MKNIDIKRFVKSNWDVFLVKKRRRYPKMTTIDLSFFVVVVVVECHCHTINMTIMTMTFNNKSQNSHHHHYYRHQEWTKMVEWIVGCIMIIWIKDGLRESLSLSHHHHHYRLANHHWTKRNERRIPIQIICKSEASMMNRYEEDYNVTNAAGFSLSPFFQVFIVVIRWKSFNWFNSQQASKSFQTTKTTIIFLWC